MSIFRQRDSLNWLSFFSISEKEKKQTLDWTQKIRLEYDSACFARDLLYATKLQPQDFRTDESATQTACEYVALKFMIEDTNFAKDILSSEDFEKAQTVFTRKQYNSKILKHLLSCFYKLIVNNRHENSLTNLFTLPIFDQIKIAQEDEINRSFGELKKTVDRVASGVKNACYFKVKSSPDFFVLLDEPLNAYVLETFGYDFNKTKKEYASHYSMNLFGMGVHERDNQLLRRALLDDAEFWNNHKDFCVVTFIKEVAKQNDIRHAEKLLAHIFNNLKSMDNRGIVFSNNFPLCISMHDEFVAKLEAQGRRFTFKRLTEYCDISKLDSLCFCYPMSSVDETRFEIGREVWNKFICEYNYPHDKEKVVEFLEKEINGFTSENIHSTNEIGVILDCGPFYFTDKEDDERKICRAYRPDFFTAENIWKRVYLKAHAVTLLSNDEKTQFSYLQRIFIDLIKTIEQQLGIYTEHQLDTSSRIKHYELLKTKLKEFGIDSSDERREDYIISLLDRDTAMMGETEHFPELEQLGDAIYGLAVAELLFYNPKTCLSWNTERKINELFEYYTRAEAQVIISKKHGFDKMFLHIGLPAKHLEYDSLFFDYESANDERLQRLNKEKYLADSLEMIIGSICRDKGIEVSIGFAKELLKTTFPETFSSEIHPTEENKHNTDIEWDYWARILPAPCTNMENEHRMLWHALTKCIMTYSLGTDGKDKRKYITTHSLGNTAIFGELHLAEISWAFYDYLQNGLDSVLQKYGDKVRESYKNENK